MLCKFLTVTFTFFGVGVPLSLAVLALLGLLLGERSGSFSKSARSFAFVGTVLCCLSACIKEQRGQHARLCCYCTRAVCCHETRGQPPMLSRKSAEVQ